MTVIIMTNDGNICASSNSSKASFMTDMLFNKAHNSSSKLSASFAANLEYLDVISMVSLIEEAKAGSADFNHLASFSASPVKLRFSKQALLKDVHLALVDTLTEQLSVRCIRNVVQSNLVLREKADSDFTVAAQSGLDDSLLSHPATLLCTFGVNSGSPFPMYARSLPDTRPHIAGLSMAAIPSSPVLIRFLFSIVSFYK
jgi:hypothetical protein